MRYLAVESMTIQGCGVESADAKYRVFIAYLSVPLAILYTSLIVTVKVQDRGEIFYLSLTSPQYSEVFSSFTAKCDPT